MDHSSPIEPLYTSDEIIVRLSEDGYKVTKRTFQFYVQSGLLPKGIRKGQQTGGVRFFYPYSVAETIKWIFELKSKGYSLTDIKRTLREYGGGEVSSGEGASFAGRETVGSLARQRGDRHASSHPADIEEGRVFLRRVMEETPGGDALTRCIQCGTCGGSCPSAEDMDHTPRHLFALLQTGLKEEVLSSNTPWFCVSCYYCTVRCPQQIPITDIMYTLKQLAAREGILKITEAYDFSRAFVSMVEKYGRSFDFGLAMRFRLTHTSSDKASWGSLALKLYKKERIVLAPSKIEGLRQLERIIERAKKRGRRE